jgi:regulatory protein
METAVRLLAQREHTRGELRQKLRQRGVTDDLSRKTLAECERLGYVNDDRTADLYVRELERKGFGPRRIRLSLKKKGVASPIVENTLSRHLSHSKELETARRVLQKKQHTYDREPDARKRREKIYRFLCSRGFSPSVITELLHPK